MLVLSRKPGERFFLGDNVEIVLLEVENGAARIGIQAPREILVLRGELKLTSKQNQTAAVLPSDAALTALIDRFRGGTERRQIISESSS